jgi:hypothetical protein
MKLTTSTLLLLAVLALPFPCLADRVRQECRTAAAADSDVPGSVRGYMDRNPGAVLRVCKQLDLNTASYYARGPISKSGEICSFAQSRIEPERGEPSSTLQYMVRSKGLCPAYESARYVPAHNTTETDFAALAKFLDELAASGDAFSSALADLSSDQPHYADVADVRAQIVRLGYLPTLSVAEFPGVLNLWSVFEVDLKSATDDVFYVLRVRRLFGHFSVISLQKANS